MLCLSAFELYSRWVPLFDGATALLAQTNKAERHVEDHEDYGGNHFQQLKALRGCWEMVDSVVPNEKKYAS